MSRHAVVIGGSLAGLCAARALVDHVDQVTVVDRDRFPDVPTVRSGVPQAHHLHVLVTAGQRALDGLFPGLVTELYEAGAVVVDTPTDVLYLTATGWRERFAATHRLVGTSRELLDWTVRNRLAADPRVRFLPAHEAMELIGADGRDAVTGVVVRPRGSAGALQQRLTADLVVDASGRGSRTPQWLARLGYGEPQQTRVDSGLSYASRRYVLAPNAVEGWKNIVLMPEPPHTGRGAVLYPIEGGRWMVTLGGLGGDRPPTDEAGFLEFAREMRSPLLYEAIKNAIPDSAIHGFRGTANHRRHYETMPRWPDGFLVVGDAACTFNPVYGQGMSVAARNAVVLGAHLRRHGGRFGRAVQARVARCSDAPWRIATGADLRYPSTVGPRPRGGALARWYLDRMADVANRDPYVCEVLTDVLHLVAPLSAVVRPTVVARVLRGRPGPRLDAPAPTASPGTGPS
ncbi:NAD(P)/FAD-dependent oxidoreductase [Solwaraspora sp. WMMB335]|uniref:NAD(P)/FAD-dependent oxidoreductase n=1 Tax=Solwaraspora sp. WMMB335 TaxID=3404118 RepID=UPI003B9493C5